MATFYSALLALGTGSGSTFVEMVGSGYAQKAVNFGTPDSSGRSLCLSVASWTPTGAWPAVASRTDPSDYEDDYAAQAIRQGLMPSRRLMPPSANKAATNKGSQS